MASVVINASAGSGKTYLLAVEFLRALFLPDAAGRRPRPEQVLATTFTRAAAAEILERVFHRLAGAVMFEADAARLAEEIGRPDMERAEMAELLAALCRALPRLQIGTLDGLFSRVVRVLGPDLALPATWEMADDTLARELALATADRLLREPEMIPTSAQWRRYAQFKPGTRVRVALAGLLEDHRFALAEAEVLEDNPDLAEPRAMTAAEADAISRALDDFTGVPLTKKGEPDSRWKKDLEKTRSAFLAETALTGLLEDALVRLALQEGATRWSREYPADLRALLGPPAERARDELRRLHLGRLPALAALARRYHDFRRLAAFTAAAYRFPEIEAAARVLPKHLTADDLYFRLDARVTHLLLDEFQDTSESQFRFLRPLIDEIVGTGRLFFAVGDVKQSIYGWRGASRRLLRRLPGLFTPPIHVRTLDANYRSSPAVLRAVDRVFQGMTDLPCFHPGKETRPEKLRRIAAARAAGEEFTNGYAPHVAAGANRALPGRVRLIVTPKPSRPRDDEEEEEAEPPGEIDAILNAVERHHTEDPHRKIAVLCRRRKWMAALIARLRGRGIEAAGEGGGSITDSAAVELILSLLTWLDHPGHTLAAEHVRRSGLLDVFGLTELQPNHPEVRALRIALFRRGLDDAVSDWVTHPDFRARCTAHDQVRCEQLVELARGAARFGDSLSRFVARVRMQRLENPAAARVKIMTVHGAKGLEFDAVILADLAGSRGGFASGPRFVNLGEPGEIEKPELLPSRRDAEVLGLLPLYEQHDRLLFEEELSVLYVGLTRARSFLDVVVAPGESGAPSLERILCDAWSAAGPGDYAVESCDAGPTEAPAAEATVMPADPAVWTPLRHEPVLRVEAAPERLDAVTPSEKEGGGRIRLGELLLADKSAAFERGTAVHALLAQVTWSEELPPLKAWLQAVTERNANVEICRRAAPDLHRRLGTPGDALREDFARETWRHRWAGMKAGTLEVWRERRFTVALGRELMSGAFDRVVLGRDARGEVRRAAILDFKTDRIEDEAMREQRQAFYQPQLDAYAEALGKMTGLAREAIETRLVWVG